MTKARPRQVILVAALVVLVAACDGSGSDETTSTTRSPVVTSTVAPTTTAGGDVTDSTEVAETSTASCDEPVKVGVVTDRSGAQAIYGTHVTRGFPLGMEYATSDPGTTDRYALDDCVIEVLYRDDASEPGTAASVARALIEDDGVDIIVGSVGSDATLAIQQVAAEGDVIHIAVPAAANELTGSAFSPNSFRTSRNNYQDAANMCRYLPGEYATFVQIAPDSSFGHGSADAFRDACTLFGGAFVADDIFAPPDTVDFAEFMDDALESEADALIVTWPGGGFVPLMRSAGERGVLDEMALVSGFVDNQLMPVLFAEGIGTTSGIPYHYTLPDNPINDWMVERSQAEFGTPPDLFDADAFNAALLIAQALRATGGDAGAEPIRDAMEGTTFEGPKGIIEVRAQDHVALQDMYIATLENLEDLGSRFFELVATNRPPVPCLLEGEYADRCAGLPTGRLTPPAPAGG